jgi:quercetin dioxygenase-like cupin family protein
VRTVLGSSVLPSVVDAPRFYKLARVQLPADKASDYRGPLGFIVVLTGSLEVAAASGRALLAPGDGLSVGEGKTTFAAKGGKPALFLHFLLLRESELDAPLAAKPATVTELFRNTAPIPGLKPGPYEFTLVRVTIPGHSPLNPPHRRSGAALYYIYAGTGTFAANGKEEIKPAGVVHFEPQTLVHQWGNAGDVPLVLIQANISQEGVPAVIFTGK